MTSPPSTPTVPSPSPSPGPLAANALPHQPNILLIMADELVAFLTGAYGHRVVRTPNMDALVAHGVRFDAAYSPSPLCAPARACLMSGMHTSTNRVYDNAALFAADIPTLGHYLTNAGYDCVLSGKMHFVGPDQLHGLRRRLTTDIYAEEFNMLDNRAPWSVARDPSLFSVEAGRGRHANNYVGSNVHVGRWHHHLSYDEESHFRALEYLRARGAVRALAAAAQSAGTPSAGPGLGAEERSAERTHASGTGGTQPFFLCVSYHHPHEPFWPSQDVWDLYEGADIDIPEFPPDMDEKYSPMDRWLNANHGVHKFVAELRSPESLYRVRRAYYALVTYIDRKVGELIATLKEHGLWGQHRDRLHLRPRGHAVREEHGAEAHLLRVVLPGAVDHALPGGLLGRHDRGAARLADRPAADLSRPRRRATDGASAARRRQLDGPDRRV